MAGAVDLRAQTHPRGRVRRGRCVVTHGRPELRSRLWCRRNSARGRMALALAEPVELPDHVADAGRGFLDQVHQHRNGDLDARHLGPASEPRPQPRRQEPYRLGMAADWLWDDRIATTTALTVGPGEVGEFRFKVRAPIERGVYRLNLRPVIDGTVW